jgi:hypothetical protein
MAMNVIQTDPALQSAERFVAESRFHEAHRVLAGVVVPVVPDPAHVARVLECEARALDGLGAVMTAVELRRRAHGLLRAAA